MNFRRIIATLIIRLKTFTRQKSAMFFTIAFPVILVLVFGAIFTKPEYTHFDLPVQDRDQTPTSRDLIESLAKDKVFNPREIPIDVDAVQYAREHKINLMIIIPKGLEEMHDRRVFDEDTKASITITYIHDPSSTSVTTKLQYLNAIVAKANQEMSKTAPFVHLRAQSILNKTYRFIEFFVPGIIAMAVMTSSLSGALNSNAELRQKGILQKLATTPITPTDWLLSNILYQLVLGFLSTVTILLVSYFVFDVHLHINGWLPIYLVLEVFAFTGMGMMLTPLAREAESATAAANAVLFPMMFLSGTFFPVEMMPEFLQRFALVLPLYYVNEGLRASMIFLDTPNTIYCALIIGAFTVAVILAGTMMTRWDHDSRGGRVRKNRSNPKPSTLKKRILFICGSINQTTQLHQVAQHLKEYDQAFTPFYCHGIDRLYRKLGWMEYTIIGKKLSGRCRDYLNDNNLPIDEEGRHGPYDLVVTCTDVYLQSNIRKNRILVVQEGITDPKTFAYYLVTRLRFLPRWIAGTAATGLSNAYRKFCVASEGYRDYFVANGADAKKIIVTGIPNFDNCEKFRDNNFEHSGYVLVCTSPLREIFRGEDRVSFIKKAVEIANGRPLFFKLHPNENAERAIHEINEYAPGAKVFTTGSAEEMIANCDELITRFSSTAFVGMALGKPTHSDFDMDHMRKLMPIQNQNAAANIANVCRELLEDPLS